MQKLVRRKTKWRLSVGIDYGATGRGPGMVYLYGPV